MDGLIYIGRKMCISKSEVQSILDPSSDPIWQLVKRAELEGRLVKTNRGRKPHSVIVSRNNLYYLSGYNVKTVLARMEAKDDAPPSEEVIEE